MNLVRDEPAVNITMICFLEKREPGWVSEMAQRAKTLATELDYQNLSQRSHVVEEEN